MNFVMLCIFAEALDRLHVRFNVCLVSSNFVTFAGVFQFWSIFATERNER